MRPLLLLLLACAEATPKPDEATPPAAATPEAVAPHDPSLGLEPASPARILRRMSLDLRGTTPTLEELAALEADSSALPALREAMLTDPRFEERLVDFFGEQWWTLVDNFDVEAYDYGLSGSDTFELRRAAGEEPLRLLAHVGARDLPWSEIVTADYTVANPLLGEVWPLDYPAGATGWQVAPWTDGRPHAGVLVSNGLWWRYRTNPFNQNRSRAAAIFRLLTCTDILARPVAFGEASRPTSPEDQLAAILTEPYCVACHAAIEPVAASLFGFWVTVQYSAEEMTRYHPERESMAAEYTSVSNAWVGEPVYGLADLGLVISQDPRFTTCAVKTMAKALWRREPELHDLPTITELDQRFRAADQRLSALVAAITDTPQYQVGRLTDAAPAEAEERERTVSLLSAEQLRHVLRDLTGYEWTRYGDDLLQDDGLGYRVLAGGLNGVNVTSPQPDPGLTWNLVWLRLVQASASYVVTHDLLTRDEAPRLFTAVTLEDRPGDDAFEAQLEDLALRTLSRRLTEGEAAALRDLWTALLPTDGPQGGWTAVLSALLLDPEFVTR